MDFGELLVGTASLLLGIWAFAMARPRDGRVRSFLRNNHAQAYYTILLLVLFATGLINILTGLIPGESMESFKR